MLALLTIGTWACAEQMRGYPLVERPLYANDLLYLPAVDTDDRLGAFQGVTLALTTGGLWRLLSYDWVGSGTLRLAPVEAVAATVTDGVPAQVLLQFSGRFNSGCGEIGRIGHRREGSHFTITVTADYPDPGQYACTMAINPFRKSWPLPVYGLPAGSYTYDLNGITGGFELAEENVAPGDCGVEGAEACSGDLLD